MVLPLLGAVPDGAIMLFSGLGDIESAQETLSVGVGALVSTELQTKLFLHVLQLIFIFSINRLDQLSCF